jgi:hypothetical protein
MGHNVTFYLCVLLVAIASFVNFYIQIISISPTPRFDLIKTAILTTPQSEIPTTFPTKNSKNRPTKFPSLTPTKLPPSKFTFGIEIEVGTAKTIKNGKLIKNFENVLSKINKMDWKVSEDTWDQVEIISPILTNYEELNFLIDFYTHPNISKYITLDGGYSGLHITFHAPCLQEDYRLWNLLNDYELQFLPKLETQYDTNRYGGKKCYAMSLHKKHPEIFEKKLNSSELTKKMSETYQTYYVGKSSYDGLKRSTVNVCKFLNVKCATNNAQQWNHPSKKNKLIEFRSFDTFLINTPESLFHFKNLIKAHEHFLENHCQ